MYEVINKIRRDALEKGVKLLDYFEVLSKDPMKVQTKLLLDLLQENKDTEYGQKYGFADITSIEEYQDRVPLTTYADYEDYIWRMTEDGERNLICANDPVWYNKTSGTMGVPKRIPYTQRTREWFERYNLGYQRGLVYREIGDKYFGGRTLNIVRCSNQNVVLHDGVPFGPISEAAVRPALERASFFFSNPKEAIFAGKGVDTRYLNARYSLADADVNNIVCTFSGFLQDFCRYVEKNWELLVEDIEKGTIDASVELPEEVRSELEAGLTPQPERAQELRAIFEQGFDTPFMPQVWPHLSYVAGGASAGFSRYTNEVRDRYLGHDVAFYYRGIIASEGIFSVPVNLADDASALIPDSLFFEFIPESDENARPLTMDQLEVGKTYELVISNHSGFYRYRMRDILLVVGYHNATPMVEFQYRVDKFVSLMSEKTSEMALRTAAEKCAEECGFTLVDSSVYADTEDVRYIYVMEIDRVPKDLTAEEIEASLQRQLCKVNPFYPSYVQNGLIKPVKVLFSQPETYVLYKDTMALKGYSVAQLKPVTVIDNEIQRKFFLTLVDDFDEIKAQCPKQGSLEGTRRHTVASS